MWFSHLYDHVGLANVTAGGRVPARDRYIPPQPTMVPRAGDEPTTEAQRQALAARARCRSPAGIEAHRRRMADAEGVIGELKNQGTAARAQRRGTPYFHVQLLLNCTAVNCKRLADHAQQAQSGLAAAPQTARSQPPAAAAPPATPPPTAADLSRWLATLLAAAPTPATTRRRSTEPDGRAQTPSWTAP